MNKLTKKLDKVDQGLKKLGIGKVLDISDLDKETIESIKALYAENYNILNPIVDPNNPGKYVLGILKYSEITLEINRLNNENA